MSYELRGGLRRRLNSTFRPYTHVQNNDGVTALYIASAEARLACVEELLRSHRHCVTGAAVSEN